MSRLKCAKPHTSSTSTTTSTSTTIDKSKRRPHKKSASPPRRPPSTISRNQSTSARSRHRNRNRSRSGASTMRNSAATTSSAATSVSSSTAAPTTSASTSTSTSANTPPPSRECGQCGNPTVLDAAPSAAARKAVSSESKGKRGDECQICAFVALRRTHRPCVACSKPQCDYFCEWCGRGFHTKCARQRRENVSSVAGFCCSACMQDEDEDGDHEGATAAMREQDGESEREDVTARCGDCERPFAATTKEKEPDDDADAGVDADSSGFHVNQAVLVDADDMLYNAVITGVDAAAERVKIHFLRWSKSFDDWYPMDDECINESLACDCCNRWFHIGCLPPIKSAGRAKDTTYVCPGCLDHAREFYSGKKSVAGASTAKKRPPSSPRHADAKRVAAKSNSNGDGNGSGKRKRTASVDEAKASVDAKISRSKSRSRSRSPSADKKLKTNDHSVDMTATGDAGNREGEGERDPAVSTPVKQSGRVDETNPDKCIDGTDTKAVVAVVMTTPSKPAAPGPSTSSTSSDQHAPSTGEGTTGDEKTPVRPPRPSGGHSVSALLNSPSSPMRDPPSPPVAVAVGVAVGGTDSGPGVAAASAAALSPATAPSQPTPASAKPEAVQVKLEATTTSQPPGPPAKQPRTNNASTTGTKRAPAVRRERAKATSKPRTKKAVTSAQAPQSSSSSSSSARGSLSAFDILREVAAQSMSDDMVAEVSGQTPQTARAMLGGSSWSNAATVDRKPVMMKPDPSAFFDSSKGHNNQHQYQHQHQHQHQHHQSHHHSHQHRHHNGPQDDALDKPLSSQQYASTAAIPMNSFVDRHFAIRKEMYLRICQLEDDKHLGAEAAQLLRTLIYPTSDRFHDLKFVYEVNRDRAAVQLTRRLLELVPGNVATAVAASSTSSASSTPNASPPRAIHRPVAPHLFPSRPSLTGASNNGAIGGLNAMMSEARSSSTTAAAAASAGVAATRKSIPLATAFPNFSMRPPVPAREMRATTAATETMPTMRLPQPLRASAVLTLDPMPKLTASTASTPASGQGTATTVSTSTTAPSVTATSPSASASTASSSSSSSSTSISTVHSSSAAAPAPLVANICKSINSN